MIKLRTKLLSLTVAATAILVARQSYGATNACEHRLAKDASLKDVEKMLHGGDPFHPAAQSLLGHYLRESGAKFRVRSFRKGPRLRGYGEKKLVVALSAASFSIYEKYFSRSDFLIHVHDPGQGTLELAYNGMLGSYGNMNSPFQAPPVGTLMPHILLKPSESARVRDFFSLAKLNQQAALTPWVLTNTAGERYCAVGAYSSCTHWVGNIPLGDELVSEYMFPGFIDEYASNHVPTNDKAPRTAPLVADATILNQNLGGIVGQPVTPLEGEALKLAQKVWTAPGHMQLHEVLGIQEAQTEGELANPGWVAYTLLSDTSLERVPVVFYVVEDHTQAIPEDFDLQIDAH